MLEEDSEWQVPPLLCTMPSNKLLSLEEPGAESIQVFFFFFSSLSLFSCVFKPDLQSITLSLGSIYSTNISEVVALNDVQTEGAHIKLAVNISFSLTMF